MIWLWLSSGSILGDLISIELNVGDIEVGGDLACGSILYLESWGSALSLDLEGAGLSLLEILDLKVFSLSLSGEVNFLLLTTLALSLWADSQGHVLISVSHGAFIVGVLSLSSCGILDTGS